MRILHRSALALALAGVVLACGVSARAQEERPEINPGERKVPRKKTADPRAVAVLEMSANGKTSLIPVAILVEGKFWDASAYKADPIPMALETGTVYEAARAGSSLGLFTVNSALHRNSPNLPDPWMGTGDWVPAGTDTSKTEMKAESTPVGIDSGDPPPRLTRDPAKVWQPASPPSGNTPPPTPKSDSGDGPPTLKRPASSAPAENTPSSTPKSDSGDGPPTLKRPASSAPDSTPPSSNTPASTTPSATAPKPTDAKAGEAKDAGQKVPESDSGAAEGNRPTLRRGKPVEPLPEDALPGYSKVSPGSAAAAAVTKDAKGAAGASTSKNTKDVVDTVPAISDASGPGPHPYTFEWLKGEEAERRDQMIAAAKEQVRSYLEAQAKARIVPKPTSATGAHHAAAAPKVGQPILENGKMVTYDLWNSNQPMMVFSAEAHMPSPPAGAAFSAVDAEMKYSVVMVAYPDMYNNLHKIYVGVTDKFHLDITPRLELIDAVDADGDRRGELLFREVGDGATGWVIYRATADKLWPLFDSLHPE